LDLKRCLIKIKIMVLAAVHRQAVRVAVDCALQKIWHKV